MCKEAIVHWRFNKIILKMKKKKEREQFCIRKYTRYYARNLVILTYSYSSQQTASSKLLFSLNFVNPTRIKYTV